MADEHWFYRDDDEWAAIAGRLKMTACPHCRTVGTLNRHGTITGYSETGRGRAVRGRRVFCSNRGRRPGCGRSANVWAAGTIHRLRLTARTVGRCLQRAVAGALAAAVRDTDVHRSDGRCGVWRRFVLAQTRVRTALFDCGPPPDTGPVAGRPAERPPPTSWPTSGSRSRPPTAPSPPTSLLKKAIWWTGP